MKKLVLAMLCMGVWLGLVSSGIAQANGSGQVVFGNSVSGVAGNGTGTFTYGGVTTEDAQIGFNDHCAIGTGECTGAFYVNPIVLAAHGNALTIQVSGTLTEVSPGVYTITLTSPAALVGCPLTTDGTPAAGGATTTQTVTVACTGNGTTTLSGSGIATAIVIVTDP